MVEKKDEKQVKEGSEISVGELEKDRTEVKLNLAFRCRSMHFRFPDFMFPEAAGLGYDRKCRK